MLDQQKRKDIIDLIHREMVPAMGCTEPIAVSLCCATAARELKTLPTSIEVILSGNLLKNAMGVGIPGTGMRGLPIAIALGVLIGRPEYDLEVLRDVCPQAVKEAQEYLKTIDLKIKRCREAPDLLFVRVILQDAEGRRVAAQTVTTHTNCSLIDPDSPIGTTTKKASVSDSDKSVELDMKTVWDFAMNSPLEELKFIEESRTLNEGISQEGLHSDYGHGIGRILHDSHSDSIMGHGIMTHILSVTSAACDARMGGAPTAVMSNSGSGNQGITATLPVTVFAADSGATPEQTLRALALSHLTVIYIKQSLGRLSALCGCVVASTGSACGITYLMGGSYETVCAAAKNMIANLTGMICDGAKPGCALKLTGGVSMAVMSALMAKNGRCVSSQEGIIDDDVDKSIHNLTTIGREGMRYTDELILDIMTSK